MKRKPIWMLLAGVIVSGVLLLVGCSPSSSLPAAATEAVTVAANPTLPGLTATATEAESTPLPVLTATAATTEVAITFPTQTAAPTEPPPTAASNPGQLPVASKPILLGMFARGGLCVYGGCYRSTIIYRDGTFETEDGSGEYQSGVVSEASLAALAHEIEQADFDLIRSKPFTDVCPTAYDGQEYIYTFYTATEAEVISSCEYVIDGNLPVFQAVFNLLDELNS